MTDLERKLEELFMSDSQSRKVGQVHVPAPRRSRFAGTVFVSGVALATLALIVAFSLLRADRETVPATSPSPSASAGAVASTGPSASPGATGDTTRSPAPTASSTSGVRPDAQHGVIARGTGEGESLMRTESDAAVLKSFPRQLSAAVTRDGLRVAYFRTTETGAQLVTFDTAKPNAEKLLIDFSGSGEVPGEVVWSSDANNELLISVHKIGQVPAPGTSVTYSSLRVIDAGTGAVREIARITNGLYMRPLAWHGSSNTAAVLEWFPAGGFAANYDYIRAGSVTRSAFEQQVVASSVRADADGQRVLSISGLPAPRGVKWWPIDRFDTRRELKTDGYDISVAHWRAGTDEIVVFPSPMSKDVPGVNPRIEAWDVVSGQKRTVAENVGPLGILRVDGSAAITNSWMLVDLRTGAVTAIPNGTINEIPYLAVRF